MRLQIYKLGVSVLQVSVFDAQSSNYKQVVCKDTASDLQQPVDKPVRGRNEAWHQNKNINVFESV